MALDLQAAKKRFQNAGNRFTFFLAVEFYFDSFAKELAKGLKDITPEKFRIMVDNGEFFKIPANVKNELSCWKKQVKWVRPQLIERLFAASRPDLYEVLVEKDTLGGIWIVNLYKFMVDMILNSEEEPVASPDEEVEVIECTVCKQSFPIKKSELANLEKCPLCGAPPDAKGTEDTG